MKPLKDLNHPAVDVAVIDLEAPLPEQAFEITATQRTTPTPCHRLYHQPGFELPAFEIALKDSSHLFDDGLQDHHEIPI